MLFTVGVAYSYAQTSLATYVSVGNNPTSQTYAQIALRAQYAVNDINFAIGAGITTAPENKLTFDAVDLQTDYLFQLPKFPLRLTGRYLYTPHRMTQMHQHDWSVSAAYCHPHVEVELGYVIHYQYSSIDNNGEVDFQRFLYRLQAYVWPKNNGYNLTVGARNYDVLSIDHQLEPIVFLGASYSYPKNVTYQIEGLYQPGGLGNILYNFYDWKVRLAIVWNFNNNK